MEIEASHNSVYDEIADFHVKECILERDFNSFKIGLLLKKAREEKHLTQEQLGKLVDKKRTYISRIENDGSNMTLKTLFDIVEKGFGWKVNISI